MTKIFKYNEELYTSRGIRKVLTTMKVGETIVLFKVLDEGLIENKDTNEDLLM